ncbi:uncharacterized protein LOC121865040 [Homarus americanus]|uniref:uncharacterized protein LOC121865040 n=1 Tax=Homarus americanus TaxID=6706 RepID=UPI001C497BF0|nr:uncharacterized protein LOC121865040 [Homarus americanus]
MRFSTAGGGRRMLAVYLTLGVVMVEKSATQPTSSTTLHQTTITTHSHNYRPTTTTFPHTTTATLYHKLAKTTFHAHHIRENPAKDSTVLNQPPPKDSTVFNQASTKDSLNLLGDQQKVLKTNIQSASIMASTRVTQDPQTRRDPSLTEPLTLLPENTENKTHHTLPQSSINSITYKQADGDLDEVLQSARIPPAWGRLRPRRDIPGRISHTTGILEHGDGMGPLGNSVIRMDVEEPPAEEVAAMISDAVTHHLAGCHKVVLYVEPYGNLVEAVVKSLEEVRQVWELDTFLTTPPPSHTIFTTTHHHHATTTLCVAIIVLADLQSVGRATKAVQRGRWFQGSHKQVLAYTGASLNLHTLTQHPYLGSGYGIVVVSWWPREENALTQHHHQQQEEKEENEISGPRVYHLLSPCPYCRDGGAEVVLIDEWQPGGCGFVLGNSLYPDTFKNFQGHRFNIVTLEYAPFSCYDKASDGGAEEGEVVLRDCVDTRILNALASTLNFTYNIREPRDHQWGYRLDNGTYTGVIGAVEKYEADFSLNVAFTGDREKVIDYTVGYFYDPLTFCTTKPRPLNQVLALIRPFQPLVWAGFVGVSMVVAPLYYLAGTVERIPSLNLKSPSISKAFLKIYGACLSQSCRWSGENGPRVLVAAWLVFSMVTLTSYVAMLTASLTLPTLSPTLNSLEQLVESDFSWGIQDQGAADYQLLKSSRVPLYQKVYRGLQVCPSLDECLARARDTKYAFITWRLYMEDRIAIRFTSATGERQLHVATNDFFPSEIGWAMNPGCPFRGKFNQQIRRLLEGGLITKWLLQIINDPKRREVVEGEEVLEGEEVPRREGPQRLGLDQLQGVFYILILGDIIASLLFVVEFYKHSP